jgi:hypothetical protein
MTILVAPPARATDDPPTGVTLLPPDGGVSILPNGEAPPQRVAPRTSPASEGSPGTSPQEAAAWGLAAVAALVAAAVGAGRVTRMLYAWRSPAALVASGFGPANGHTTTTFSLLVPARRGDDRLAATLEGLAGLDHPAYEVVAVVGYDDLPNRSAAAGAAVRHPDRVQVVVDRHLHRSRAARLNVALDECRGEVVGLVEPGDEVHPRLLRHVDAALADPAVGAVQGGVRQVAGRHRWFTARSIVAQYFWSRSRLAFHARQRFSPLERTTAFVRARVLRENGGWDERCVDEAAELGVRLSVRDVPIAVAYGPELATWRLTPATLRGLLGEHRRRVRGQLQVLRKGEWRALPTRRQRVLARLTLARPVVEALTVLGVAAGLVAVAALRAPTPALVLAALPALPFVVAVGAELAALSELARVEGHRARLRDRAWLVVSALPVELLIALATFTAVVSEWRGAPVHEPPVPVAPGRHRRQRRDDLQPIPPEAAPERNLQVLDLRAVGTRRP